MTKMVKGESGDVNFDSFTERFYKNIYESIKGQIRLKIIFDEIETQILANICPESQSGVLSKNVSSGFINNVKVLDAAGGFSPVGTELAARGFDVTVSDISRKMLDKGIASADEPELKKRIHRSGGQLRWVCDDIRNLKDHMSASFDIVLFHGAAEWTRDPRARVFVLSQLVKPCGFFSFMFYNRQAMLFNAVLRGNYDTGLKGDVSGNGKTLTPVRPISQEEAILWMEENGFDITSVRGVRVFYDYIHRYVYNYLRGNGDIARILEKHLSKGQTLSSFCEEKITGDEFDKLIKLEMIYSKQKPFCSLGRHILLTGKKQTDG